MTGAASMVAAAALLVGLALSATAGAQTNADALNIYAAASLTEVFQAYDKAPEVQLRRLERARDADQATARRPTSSPRRHRSTPSGSSPPASSTSRSRSPPTGSR